MFSLVSSLPILLLFSSLIASIQAQGFNNPQRTSSTTSTSTSTSTSTTTRSTTTRTSSSATPTSTSVYGQCVDACITVNPIVNHCDGTETGSALDQCKCKSYTPSNDPLIGCVQSCPSDEQYNFARSLPSLCAQTLFLGLDLTDAPKPNAVNTVASATLATAQAQNTGTATATASGNGAGTLRGMSVLGLLAVTVGVVVFL
ncbi:hypothetical protein G647_06680 [Cladophialophora carrionii CBS 160.54]|uniref:Extracellular membrane protein CFEM domain-containing protein n=1 Tax=Cladophialophora carrionii CBS 160.54 TaxID=1279043 RepID=V9D6R4_9EURO|nr:uncharacterized protein G647_06680 [Cladophialophora carrionii CBS 160.54]ETI22604.1 hypothetical protein G647_06680 [Cladophialophora carrionii CBS 160.54]